MKGILENKNNKPPSKAIPMPKNINIFAIVLRFNS